MHELSPTDPAALAALAARTRHAGDRVSELSHRLDVRVAATHFEGPAAVRLAVAMSEAKLRSRSVAEELWDIAALLSSPTC